MGQITELLQRQVTAKRLDLAKVRCQAGVNTKDVLLLLQGQNSGNPVFNYCLARELGFGSWEQLQNAALSGQEVM